MTRETRIMLRRERKRGSDCDCTCDLAIRPCGRPSCAPGGGSECCGVLRFPVANSKDQLRVVYDLAVDDDCEIIFGLMIVEPAKGTYQKKVGGAVIQSDTVTMRLIKPAPGCNIEPWDLKDSSGDFVPVGSYDITIAVLVGCPLGDGRFAFGDVCEDWVPVEVYSCEAIYERYKQEAQKYGLYDRRGMYIERLLMPVSADCICRPAMDNLERETPPPFDDPCFLLCVNKRLADLIFKSINTPGGCMNNAYKRYQQLYDSAIFFNDIGKCENILRAMAMKRCGKTKFTAGDKAALAACIQKIVDAFAKKQFGKAAALFGPKIADLITESENMASGTTPMGSP